MTATDTRTPAKTKTTTASAPGPVTGDYAWTWAAGPVAGPALAAGGVMSLSMLGDLAAVNPWWAVGTTTLVAVAAGARDVLNRVSRLGAAYRATCWMASGAWATYAMTGSPWDPTNLTALAAGTTIMGVLAAPMGRREAGLVEAARVAGDTARSAAQRLSVAVEWEARIGRVARIPGAVITAVETWPTNTGFTLRVNLPEGGVRWSTLAAAAPNLAADADLPTGCVIEVAPGPTMRVAFLRVATTAPETLVVYPDDTTPLTFTGELPLGKYQNGTVATIRILEDPLLIVGRRGSGKSNGILVLLAALVRCVDTVIWVIDPGGVTGIARKFLAPWLNGATDKPVIDWVATNYDDVELMLDAAIAIATGRKTVYAPLMTAVDDDKIPISAEVPAIVLLVDEGAESLAMDSGHGAVATKLASLLRIARSARVQIIVSAVDAKATTIPPVFKSQAGVSIFCRPDKPHEVAQLHGWRGNGSVPDVAPEGSMLLKLPNISGVTWGQIYRIKESQTLICATAMTPHRPDLDAPSVKLMVKEIGPDVYAHRWDRYLSWLAEQDDGKEFHLTAPKGMATANAPKAPRTSTGSPAEDMAAAFGAAQDALDKMRQDTAARNAKKNDDALFAEIVAGFDADPQEKPAAPKPLITPKSQSGPARMVAILAAAGPGGMTVAELTAGLAVEGFTPSTATIYTWLNAAKTAGTVSSPEKGTWVAVIDGQ
jgi:S-DNA-T family DNA segregation ATPase FtsK/SpoIIIE